jgi:hypothetical protein
MAAARDRDGVRRRDFAEYFDPYPHPRREKALARHSAASRRAAALDSLQRLKVGDVDPGAVGAAGRAGGRAGPRRRGLRRAQATRATEDRLGRPDHGRASSRRRWWRWPAYGCRSTSTTGPRRSGGTWPPPCARSPTRGRQPAGRAAPPWHRRGRGHAGAAARDAQTPVPRLPRTRGARPAGPNGGPRLERDTVALREKVATAPARWPARSTGCAGCSRTAASCTAATMSEPRPDAVAASGAESDSAGGRVPAPRGVGRVGPGELAAAVSVVVYESRRES